MKKAVMFVAVAGLLAAPSEAAEWNDVRPGTFVGARLTIGGKTKGRPSAALMIAPTQNRISHDGMVGMRIGEGLAFNLTPGSRPTLTLAGVRADTALGLRPASGPNSSEKLGISKGAAIAIGVGAALVIGAAVFYSAATNCEDHDDECG